MYKYIEGSWGIYTSVKGIIIYLVNGLSPADTKPLPEPGMACTQRELKDRTSLKFEQKIKDVFLIPKSVFFSRCC